MKKLLILLILFTTTISAIAGNRIICAGVPGASYCVVILRNSDMYRWNTNTSDFAASVSKTYQAIDLVPSPDVNVGVFSVPFPAEVNAGDYTLFFYNLTAAVFDPNYAAIGVDTWLWDGTDRIY